MLPPEPKTNSLNVQMSLWSLGNDFKFSATKTTCIHFCRLQGVFPHPNLFMNSGCLQFAETLTFLGLVLDSCPTWKPHIWQLETKYQLSLNILHILADSSWGASRVTVFGLCCCLVCSQLDNRSFIYTFASKRMLYALDPIHNSSIQLHTDVFRTRRVESLYTELGEPALAIRQQILLCSYAAKLSALKKHTSPLSNEGLRSIQRQAVWQVLDSRFSLTHFIFLHPPSSLLKPPLHHSLSYIILTTTPASAIFSRHAYLQTPSEGSVQRCSHTT
jgi:hypothetical protein